MYVPLPSIDKYLSMFAENELQTISLYNLTVGTRVLIRNKSNFGTTNTAEAKVTGIKSFKDSNGETCFNLFVDDQPKPICLTSDVLNYTDILKVPSPMEFLYKILKANKVENALKIDLRCNLLSNVITSIKTRNSVASYFMRYYETVVMGKIVSHIEFNTSDRFHTTPLALVKFSPDQGLAFLFNLLDPVVKQNVQRLLSGSNNCAVVNARLTYFQLVDLMAFHKNSIVGSFAGEWTNIGRILFGAKNGNRACSAAYKIANTDNKPLKWVEATVENAEKLFNVKYTEKTK